MNNKLFNYVDSVSESYSESIQIMDGLVFDMDGTLRTIEFYTNNQYLSGNKDELGKEKPFYNIVNFRVTVAKTATDIDLKDIRFEPDSLEYAVETMLINKELYKYLKEINFSNTLNEMGYVRPKYGGVLIKRYNDGEGMEIEVVEWCNVKVDPTDILGGLIIETHYMSASEFMGMDEWGKQDECDSKEDVLKAHAKQNKNKPAKIIIQEVHGELPEEYYPENWSKEKDGYGYVGACLYFAVVGNKKFLMYYETEKDIEDTYKYLAWEKVSKRGLGKGVVEDGFEAQTWTNDVMISYKNAMDLSGKVLLATTSKKLGNTNALTDVKSGHMFELEDGKTISSLNISPSAFPEFQNVIALWEKQYNNISSTYDANTGATPPSGTPYSQTALLNQVANSPFEYRKEEWGIFLNEVLNDWVLDEVKKRIIKSHDLVSDFTDEELATIDESIANYLGKSKVIENLTKGIVTTPEMDMMNRMGVKNSLRKKGKKRSIKIPKGYLDIEGKISANITGEMKNKQAIIASLDNILAKVAQTYNPQTGSFALLDDPRLSKIFGTIVEMAGVPISMAQLKSPTGTNAVAGADLSSISNATPIPSNTPTI